jgi:hypothetical protein
VIPHVDRCVGRDRLSPPISQLMSQLRSRTGRDGRSRLARPGSTWFAGGLWPNKKPGPGGPNENNHLPIWAAASQCKKCILKNAFKKENLLHGYNRAGKAAGAFRRETP